MPYKDPEQARLNGEAYRAEHREEARVRVKKWREDNPEKWRAQSKKRAEKYPAYRNARAIALKEAKAGRPRPTSCEICGTTPNTTKGMHWDHDHATGLFRGWLCNGCNHALGNVRERPEVLEALATYIRNGGIK